MKAAVVMVGALALVGALAAASYPPEVNEYRVVVGGLA